MKWKLLIRALGQLYKFTKGKKANHDTMIITIAFIATLLFFILSTAFSVVSTPGLTLQAATMEKEEKLIAEEDISNAKITKASLIDSLLASIKTETGKTAIIEGVVDDYELMILCSVKYGKYFDGARLTDSEVRKIVRLMVKRDAFKLVARPFLEVIEDQKLGLTEEQKNIAKVMWTAVEGEPIYNYDVAPDVELPKKYAGGGMLWPVPGHSRISSPYGYRMHPVLHVKKLHTGTDIPGATGTPIVAAADGVVVKSGRHASYGNMLLINHGGGIETLYAHCSKLLVSAGTKVAKGDTIAEIGMTGRSTGPHLHFEVRKNGEHQDPQTYVTYVQP